MGGRSRSSQTSNQTTTTVTQQTGITGDDNTQVSQGSTLTNLNYNVDQDIDNSQQIDNSQNLDGTFAIGQGSNSVSTINMVDPGALSFASDALKATMGFGETLAASQERQASLIAGGLADQTAASAKSITEAATIASGNKVSDIGKWIPIAAIIAVGILGVAYLNRKRG
jgi:hypothetical protein